LRLLQATTATTTKRIGDASLLMGLEQEDYTYCKNSNDNGDNKLK